LNHHHNTELFAAAMKALTIFNTFALLFILSNLVYFAFLRPFGSNPNSKAMLNGRNSYARARFDGKHRFKPLPREGVTGDSVMVSLNDVPGKRPAESSVVVSSDHVEKQADTAPRLKRTLFNLVSDNATPAGFTALGYKGFVYSNPDLTKKISEGLIKHRVKREVAEKTAVKIAKAASGKLFRKTSLGTMVAGIGYIVANYWNGSFSFLEKLSLGICSGLLLILLYSGLMRRGIME
jgi:hypothetical protein